ncbi:MAG: hypothetical protein PQJ61_14700 [Spirochaetales bacterium]|uniref:CopG family transcriptional regulator n=1 Tax=Candidatus Thalassospirochaeta sargassi TaxID=3119039 RepID=A0AAJ1IEX5_9SPIO|nr:hypothetical protein [Spirochaetales bacterium]
MKTLSLKMDDDIFTETEEILAQVKKARNRYINEAVDYYNKLAKRKILEQQFQNDSTVVRDDSMAVLNEFEAIEDDG